MRRPARDVESFVDGQGFHWRAAPSTREWLEVYLVPALNEGEHSDSLSPLKRSSRRQVDTFCVPGQIPAIVKRYPARAHWGQRLRERIHPRAVREFLMARYLVERGIPVPRRHGLCRAIPGNASQRILLRLP